MTTLLRSRLSRRPLLVFLLMFTCLHHGVSNPVSKVRAWIRITPIETQKLEGPACMLDQASLEVTSDTKQQKLRQGFLWTIPVLSSILASTSFNKMTQGFHELMQYLSKNQQWVPIDDATALDLQTQVITQVVNGPVITSISVLFATLVSTTVSSLHERQMQMESLFTKQIDELRLLQVILRQLPESLCLEAKQYTHEYAERLIQDERGGDDLTDTLDLSLRQLLLVLQQAMVTTMNEVVANPMLGMAYDAVTRIQRARSDRWTALQTRFPAMHYVTLTLLALAICISFLVATDQSRSIFQSLQVRILWTILIGSFTSLAVVCYDLASPFAGAYQIVTKVNGEELSVFYEKEL